MAEKPVLAASFGEYRGRRFHMGLDLSTGGVEGRRVYPVADGIVFKVRHQVRGYGRSVYVRHKGGTISVYAHLAEFGPGIKDVLPTGIGYFKARSVHVSVTRSDILAYSGESGSGLPHLHFEIRDAANQPMNPLGFGLPLDNFQESIRIEAIRLLPLDPDGQVNGSHFPVTLTRFDRPIRALGRMGIEICGYVATSNGNHLGFTELKISVNGVVSSRWNPQKLSYNVNRQAGKLFNRYFSVFSPTRYVYSFTSEKMRKMPGLIDFKVVDIEENTDVSVLIRGICKNRTIHLKLIPEADIQVFPPVNCFSEFQGFSLWNGRLKVNGSKSSNPEIRVLKPGAMVKKELLSGDLLAVVRLSDQVNASARLGPWTVESSEPGCMLALEKQPQKTRKGLFPQSGILSMEHPGKPVKRLVVSWQIPPQTSRKRQLGLYGWSPVKGTWRFQQPLQKGRARFVLPFYSRVGIFRDSGLPVIGKVKSHHYFHGTRRVISLRDRESGIDWSSVLVQVKERALAYEADSDRGWIILPVNCRGGFSVTVRDRAGNATTRIFNTEM